MVMLNPPAERTDVANKKTISYKMIDSTNKGVEIAPEEEMKKVLERKKMR